jgi:hypothetical protein
MDNTNSEAIKYTREDLLRLREFLAPGSIVLVILEGCDYDPEELSVSLCPLKKEWEFIYETPLNELPLTMNDPRFEGWRRWRLSIGK